MLVCSRFHNKNVICHDICHDIFYFVMCVICQMSYDICQVTYVICFQKYVTVICHFFEREWLLYFLTWKISVQTISCAIIVMLVVDVRVVCGGMVVCGVVV